MRISKPFFCISIGLLFLVVSAVTALLFIDPAIFRTQLETRASAAFGRPFQIKGPIHLKLSLRPQIILEEVTIDNVDWAAEEPFAKIEETSIQVGLFSLFRGHLRVFNVAFKGVDLFIEEKSDGTHNYTFGNTDEKRTSGSLLPPIERLLIKDATILYDPSGPNNTSRYKIAEARLWNIPGEPERIEAKGLARGIPYNILFVANEDADLSSPQNPWLFQLDIEGADMSLTVEGEMVQALNWETFDAHINIHGGETDELETLTNLALPDLDAFAVSASVNKDKDTYTFTEFKGHIRGNQLWKNLEIEKGNGLIKKTERVELFIDTKLNTVPVSLSFKGGLETKGESSSRDWPVQLKASSPGTILTGEGSVIHTESGSKFQMMTRIQGNRSDTLSTLLGLSLPSVTTYELSGSINSGNGIHELENIKIQMGSNYFSGNLRWEDKAPRPLLTAELSANELRLNELFGTRLDIDSPSSSQTKPPSLLERPIKIDWLKDFDTKLDIDLQRILDRTIPLEQLKSKVVVTNGALNAQLQSIIGGAPMDGELDLSEVENGLDVSLKAEIRRIDVDTILGQLNRPNIISGSVDTLHFNGNSSGGTLQALLEQAELNLQLRPSNLSYTGNLHNDRFLVTLNSADFTVGKSEPVVGTLTGTLQDTPFKAIVRTGTLVEIQKTDAILPVLLDLEIADLQVKAETAIPRSLKNNTLSVKHEIRGKAISALDPLLGIELPFRGEFHSKGKIAIYENRFIYAENLRVGKTNLKASITVLNESPRPKITGTLATDELYLDDLELFNADKKTDKMEGAARVIPDYTIPIDAFSVVDLNINIEAKRVITGIGNLKDLIANVNLQDGRLQSSLSTTSFKGGKIKQEIELNTAVTPPQNRIHLDIKDFNYGFLNEQMHQRSWIQGLVDIQLTLTGSGATRDSFLADANGRVTIIGGPGQITGQGIDLWAADLIPKMLSTRWRRESITDIQCFVGNIQIDEGQAKIENILFDTQRVTIAGSGTLTLETEALDLFIVPRPKRASLVSLANPVRVKGALSEPKISITRLPRQRLLSGIGIAGSFINPAFLILVLSDTGTRSANPCFLAIEQAQQSANTNSHLK